MSTRKDLTSKQRDAVLREAGYRCANPVCGIIIVLDVHHIVEVHIGGGNEIANLLALCPTCHALYHRETISIESIRHWKQRLIAIDKAGLAAGSLDSSSSTERRGFALAYAEYSWRTCRIGLLQGNQFKPAGLCTFVAPSLAITTARLVETITSHAPEFGLPTISTRQGFAPFNVKRIEEETAIVEMGIIDDAEVKKIVKDQHVMAALMAAPLQTPVRYRMLPFTGESVGLLHSPKTTAKHRGAMEFQFDQSVVSFMNNPQTTGKHFQFTLAPVATSIEEEGAPVFTVDGRLLGLVADTVVYEGDLGPRPVIINLLGLRSVLPDPGK